jgi:hypothetical protein
LICPSIAQAEPFKIGLLKVKAGSVTKYATHAHVGKMIQARRLAIGLPREAEAFDVSFQQVKKDGSNRVNGTRDRAWWRPPMQSALP